MHSSPDPNDPALVSWLESANDESGDFPIQNMPYGRFRREGEATWTVGVAIGNQVLDLRRAGLVGDGDMNALVASPPAFRRSLRLAISSGLRHGSLQRPAFERALVPQAEAEMALPCSIGDYTDFYVGIHHATAVGKLFRPDAPLLPNYKWVPIGYHGRASTIEVSGGGFPRPCGQVKRAGTESPVLQPTASLDFELELGILIGAPNAKGAPITMDEAEEHVFGLALFNDWSARDFQAWEYQPLGPFLSKNFASTLSPWIVPMEALAPFRRPFSRPAGDPAPLPYLDSASNRESGAIDIELEVWLQTETMRRAGSPGERISRSNFADAAYWSVRQLVAHHTVNGCGLRSGDLLGTGTLSGPAGQEAGSLLELSTGGKRPLRLMNGEERTFLEDGDSVILRAHCQREGFRRIGFGECRGTVLPPTRSVAGPHTDV